MKKVKHITIEENTIGLMLLLMILELIVEEKTIKIPKGTVYITFGIPDPPTSSDSEETNNEEDDNEEGIKDDKIVPTHKIKSAHRKTGKSMFC